MGRIKELYRGASSHDSDVVTGYFHWLCDEIEINKPDKSYWLLAKMLHSKPYYWSVPNDDNRGEDGKRMRNIFAEGCDFIAYERLDGPCMMLEMLVGVAFRCEDMMVDFGEFGGIPRWFWEMMQNIGLDKFDDENYIDRGGSFEVDRILTEVLDRGYGRTGKGGLFPLKKAKKDQRKVEIWYQMCAYLLENYYFDGDNS